jgi:hypothetical protein
MRSKKINRHHIARQNFMEIPKKNSVFAPENLFFGPNMVLIKMALKEFILSFINLVYRSKKKGNHFLTQSNKSITQILFSNITDHFLTQKIEKKIKN